MTSGNSTNVKKEGWRQDSSNISLSEINATIKVPTGGSFWKKLFAFVGPGLMVAVGYMDPGNWATDLEGGSRFGYILLSVILLSNVCAMILQHLALKLGIATGRDLAQACRDSYSKPVSFVLWILCEIAIIACDLAEVLGASIALNLLFGIPLTVGAVLTILDVIIVLYLQNKGFRYIEALVAGLLIIIFMSFAYEILVSNPNIAQVMSGFIPRSEIIWNQHMLYIAIGIIGATVMPHNLYLHSSIVQSRNFTRDENGKKEAVKFATIDSTVSLAFALFVNAAILILAATTFFQNGRNDVVEISDAYKLLNPILGVKFAALFFGIALLASGLNSTLTGTLAGQIVMEGFLNLKMKPWIRRAVTRSLAVIPCLIVTSIYGERGVTDMLVLSQVILTMQLPFAIVPLVAFTSSKAKMGIFKNPLWLTVIAWIISAIIISLSLTYLYLKFFR